MKGLHLFFVLLGIASLSFLVWRDWANGIAIFLAMWANNYTASGAKR